jgi:general stress protein YciG
MGVMKIPDNVKEYFREQGRIGGEKRNASLTPERRQEIARAAARARWAKGEAEEERKRKGAK